jgi:hypothetical protein
MERPTHVGKIVRGWVAAMILLIGEALVRRLTA